ncbi:MAG: SGNH/GDSL hydrolase family protein [Verrucomicrobiota bacterium]
MKITLIGILLLGCVLSSFAQPTQKLQTTNQPVKDPAFDRVTDTPNLPRILLIGDSISMGYTVPVRKLLKDKANVHRIPENGGPTSNGLAKMKVWLGESRWDVIHFNFGLHDLRLVTPGKQRIPPEAYEKNLRKLVRQLQETKAKLIWATTTPVPPGPFSALGRATEDVPIYNAVAAKVMEENGIVSDDLYAFALPQLSKIQKPVNVHYTEEGYEVLAKKVAASIEPFLPKSK